MTRSRSADGFAPRHQERLAAVFQGAIAMDIEVQGRAMEPQVLGHLRGLGGAIGERGHHHPQDHGRHLRSHPRSQEGRIEVKKPFLVDVPSHEAYHAGHSREPHQTPVHCTHHTEPLPQKLQA